MSVDHSAHVDATLDRFEESDQGTFGRFSGRGLIVYSGELPWRDNQSSISRIKPGSYRCDWLHSPRFGRFMYLVNPVSGRIGIRIHSANLVGDAALNYKSQLNGCIAFGERMGWIEGQKAILLSAPAVRRVEQLFAGRSFSLLIRDLF